jgi:capsular exopolysaccharide synthesis family protein
MNDRKKSPSSPLINVSQSAESDEGGLNLGQFLAAIRRRWFLIVGVTTLVTAAALWKALTDTPVHQGSFQILTEPVTGEGQVISSLPQTIGREEKSPPIELDETKLQVLQSPKLLLPVFQRLQAQYPTITYNSIISNLEIKNAGKNTNVLEVSYQDANRDLVLEVLNLVKDAYLNYSGEERQKDVIDGIKFVEDQLPQLRTQVEMQQLRLQKLRQQYNLVDPASKAQELSVQISAFRQQLLDTQLQLDQALSRYSDLEKQLAKKPGEGAAAVALRDNPRYQKILDQIQEVDRQIAQEASRFQADNPIIQDLRQQRQNLLPLLLQEQQRVQQEMLGSIQELQGRYQTLNQNIAILDRQLKQLPAISRSYDAVQQELKIASDNLNQFLAKKEALRIEEAQKQVPWQLIAPPALTSPIDLLGFPVNVKNYLAVGTLLGLLLGTAVALIVDKVSNVLYTLKEIKSITRLPVLGVVPWDRDLKELAPAANIPTLVEQSGHNFGLLSTDQPQDYKATPFFEAFRFLYTNIRLLSSDDLINALIVSSPTAGDGKSTIAAHLAQAAAVMGQRVLLVDTDLRRPSVHDRLGVSNMQGLTDVIANNLDFNNLIQRSPLEDNLFVLTAGLMPPDPIRLLASEKMKELMSKLQADFDLVIYDTPPLLECADAYLLAPHTNGIVLVTALGKLKRHVLEEVIEDFKTKGSGAQILGLVANRAKGSAISTSGYQRRGYNSDSRPQKQIDFSRSVNAISTLDMASTSGRDKRR